jgi:DNA gyrase subunit A
MQIIKDELLELKAKYGDKRRTEIEQNAEDFNPEDFYADEDMIITISYLGYIIRTPLSEFKTQGRGGVGSKGGAARDEDFLEHMFVASMHNTLLLFTRNGKCYWLKVWQIPEGTRTSKGRAIQNVLNISPDDKVLAYIKVKSLDDQEFINNNFIILATKQGIIKKTTLEAYSRPRVNGVNAISIREGDELIEARRTSGNHEIMMAVRSGKAIRFNEEIVRPIGRTSMGVRGITLGNEKDEVIGMICVNDPTDDVLVLSENGYGKRSSLADYRITNRGGKGVKTINITDKTGNLISIKNVGDDNDLMIITQNGLTIRVPVKTIRVMGRAAQGVRIINLKQGDSIASVAKVRHESEEKESSENDENVDDQV